MESNLKIIIPAFYKIKFKHASNQMQRFRKLIFIKMHQNKCRVCKKFASVVSE